MKKNDPISLIDGSFEPKEAKEILTSLLSDKIQFHKMKNFSSRERFGKEDEKSNKRIPELKNSIQQVLELIEDAEKNDKHLMITSQIVIELVDVKEVTSC